MTRGTGVGKLCRMAVIIGRWFLERGQWQVAHTYLFFAARFGRPRKIHTAGVGGVLFSHRNAVQDPTNVSFNLWGVCSLTMNEGQAPT